MENCRSFKGFGFLYKYIDDVGLFVLGGNVFIKSLKNNKNKKHEKVVW